MSLWRKTKKKFYSSKLYQITSRESVVVVAVGSEQYNEVLLMKTKKHELMSELISEGLQRARQAFDMPGDLIFIKCKLEDGTCKENFGQEEKIGNKHIVLYYRSSESMNDRLVRLEKSMQELKDSLRDLKVSHDELKAKSDETNQYILCGEIAYFVDKLASTAVYGSRVAESRHISVGQLLAPWREFTPQESARMTTFWHTKFSRLTPSEVKRRLDILRTARFPHAHQDEESKQIDRNTFMSFIEARFAADDAKALSELLDCVIDSFSSSATPLVARPGAISDT